MTAEKTCADKEAAKAAGNERFAAGDAAGALAFWARARVEFKRRGPARMRVLLCAAWSGRVPEDIASILTPQKSSKPGFGLVRSDTPSDYPRGTPRRGRDPSADYPRRGAVATAPKLEETKTVFDHFGTLAPSS